MIYKTIVVTGASRGIGKALVEVLAANKEHHIIALSRDLKTMQHNFNALENVSSYAFDLELNVKVQITSITEKYPKIDLLINNAGYLVKSSIPNIERNLLMKSFEINYFGVVELVQALLPKMTSSISHIVNISSMGAFQGSVKFPELSAYTSAKAALCNFTELFAAENEGANTRMNCLCLGAVQTEMLSEAFPGYEASCQPEEMAKFIADFGLKSHYFLNGKIIPISLSTP